MKSIIVALVSGTLFGIGLDIGGMTNPANIIGFLDVAGNWNPSLIFVMVGAIVVTFTGYRLAFRQGKPIWAASFQIPTKEDFDGRLLGGSALFGIGWGLAGYCPGPAFSALTLNNSGIFVFVIVMLVGMLAVNMWDKRAVEVTA